MGFYDKISGMPSGAYSSQQAGNMQKENVPSGYRQFQLQNYTPEQMKLHQSLYGHVGQDSYLSKLAQGDEDIFNEIEAPALRQFNELQGGLASRFSGMGMGSRNSSGFQNTANSAASNFAQELQANRQALSRQALQDLMGYSNEILNQNPYEKGLVEKRQKQSSGWGGVIGTGIGAAGGFMLGGPMGAFAGAKIGQKAGSAF